MYAYIQKFYAYIQKQYELYSIINTSMSDNHKPFRKYKVNGQK